MKRRISILSTASVFFLVLILLISCGIATRFYIESSIRRTTSTTDDAISATYSVTSDRLNSLGWIDTGTGPSLMLFYLISGSEIPPSGIISKFDTLYQRNNVGAAISSDEVLSLTSASTDYTLYRFSDDFQSTFQSPGYIATANNPLSPNFSITVIKTPIDDSHVAMNLQFDTGAYTIHNPSPTFSPSTVASLRRFNGVPFQTNVSTVIGSQASYPEYSAVGPTTGIHLHIYGAVNVSQGDFNNIYWTDLAYLGNITLSE
ncbi:MAG: hypothetical protein AB7D92_01630 [Sphaerochaeta sp.]